MHFNNFEETQFFKIKYPSVLNLSNKILFPFESVETLLLELSFFKTYFSPRILHPNEDKFSTKIKDLSLQLPDLDFITCRIFKNIYIVSSDEKQILVDECSLCRDEGHRNNNSPITFLNILPKITYSRGSLLNVVWFLIQLKLFLLVDNTHSKGHLS